MGSPVETATDLKQLPLRALVAYAARCARRVQSEYAPDPANPESARCIEAIENAISIAEQVAFGEDPSSDVFAEAEETAVKAMMLVSGEENGNSAAAYAANAAYAAIDAAAAVRSVADGENLDAASEKVADAAGIAFDAASAIREDAAGAARLDWEMLHRMHLGKFPAIGEDVNPWESGILGPLFRKSPADGKKKSATKSSSALPSARAEETKSAEPSKTQAVGSEDMAATLKLREAAELLRARQDDLCAFEAKLEEDRHTLESEREAVKAGQAELESQRADLGRQAAALEIDRARGINDAKAAEAAATRLEERQKELEQSQAQLEAERSRLAEQRTNLLAEIERLWAEKAQLEKEREALGQKAAQSESVEADLKRRKESIEEERSRVAAEREKLLGEIERLRGEKANLEKERESLGQKATHSATVAADLERQRESLDEERERLAGQRELLKADSEKLVAKKEADIHKALKQLPDERKPLQPGDDALATSSLTQTPKEAVTDLRVLLTRLHEERTRLKVEREQLAEVFALISQGGGLGGSRAAKAASRSTAPQSIEGPRLRMIIQPGNASSSKLSDLLVELSLLDRQLGGPGVEFIVRECRLWRPSALVARTSSEHPAAMKRADANPPTSQDRSFVEIYLVPQEVSATKSDAKFTASHWDRFTASLFMVLRLDAGQVKYFEMAEAASRDHPSYVLAADAAFRASRKATQGEGATAMSGGSETTKEGSFDAINQQLQRIEELRRRFERDDSLILELAPAVEVDAEQAAPAPTAPAAPPTNLLKSKRRLAIKLEIAAAALALIAGLWWLLRGF